MATRLNNRGVTREVDSRRGAMIVSMESAGMYVRIKGYRTTYGPISYNAIYELGAKMAAAAAIKEQPAKRASRRRAKVGLR